MQPIRTILAPTDFSKEATNALVYAVNLASRISVKLVIIHIDDEQQREITGAANAEGYEDYVKDRFERIEHDFLYGRQLNYEFKIYHGQVAETIRKAANSLQADMIILGRKGKGSVYEERMGSIAVSLLDRAPCTVMAIPGNCRKLDLRHITVASDMSTVFPEHQLYTLEFMIASINSHLRIVKINRQKELHMAGDDGENVREKFNRILSTTIHDYHEIDDEDLVQGLEKFTDHYESDLLVLLKKNRAEREHVFGPRLSNVMTLSAKIPLMIIPVDN